MNLGRTQRRLAVTLAALILPGALVGCEQAAGRGSTAAIGHADTTCGGTTSLKASGSSMQAGAMALFTKAYEAACPRHTLQYAPSGSVTGIAEFLSGQHDFAGSDSPLNPQNGEVYKSRVRCSGYDAVALPLVFAPIAITYNLPGVDSLVLDGPTAAMIFNGTITNWAAPQIAALNPSRQLPSQPITVIFRSDQSGTTQNFQRYLDSASAGAWGKILNDTFFVGGVGKGANGNDGTAAAVKETPGSITYSEWSAARSHDLSVAQIKTDAGADPVTLSVESVGKSVQGVIIKGHGNFLLLDTTSLYRPTQPGAYPIVLATYEIVCSKYPDRNDATAVKAFLNVALDQDQKSLADAGYIPPPETLKSRLNTAINAIA